MKYWQRAPIWLRIAAIAAMPGFVFGALLVFIDQMEDAPTAGTIGIVLVAFSASTAGVFFAEPRKRQ